MGWFACLCSYAKWAVTCCNPDPWAAHIKICVSGLRQRVPNGDNNASMRQHLRCKMLQGATRNLTSACDNLDRSLDNDGLKAIAILQKSQSLTQNEKIWKKKHKFVENLQLQGSVTQNSRETGLFPAPCVQENHVSTVQRNLTGMPWDANASATT